MNRREWLINKLQSGSVLLWAGAGLSLSSCARQDLNHYSKELPKLDLREYFNGRVSAWGVFTDRSGQVVKRFVVDMQCSWQRNAAANTDEGILDERFTYSDGTKQQRIWRLTRHADGAYTGRADDVVGQASGRESGNAFYWTYTLALPVDGSVYNVEFEDWMYLVDQKVMLNKARMSKWGVHLGDVTLSFSKHS